MDSILGGILALVTLRLKRVVKLEFIVDVLADILSVKCEWIYGGEAYLQQQQEP